jgi:hypothetical protein
VSKKSIREKQRLRRRNERIRSYLIWGGAAIGIVTIFFALIWPAIQPADGQEIPIMGADHVTEGSDPGPYNSDPPTSGPHYANSLEAGFYDEADLDELGPHPEGYLVHNLEHGYVIFWYNCTLLEEDSCDDLKADLGEVLERENNFKVIAFPWDSTDVPVVITSWGRYLALESFNLSTAERFISRNRNRAPEPLAE